MSAVVVIWMVGCASEMNVPDNARLKTGEGPLIQAHRGSRGEYDDNAAGGFRWCLEKGLRGFETDVRFSKDRQLVIMHDARVERTTDGNGLAEDLSFAELSALRLKACGEPVPTADDVLKTLDRRSDIFVEVEMKAYPSAFYTPEMLEEYCRRLNETVRAWLAPGTYAFTCSNTNTLTMMRRVNASAPLGYIVGAALEESHIETARSLGCCSIAPKLATSAEMVARAQKEGLSVCLWMVQNAVEYAEAKAKGADRVTSDYPNLLAMAVHGRRKKLVLLDSNAVQVRNGARNAEQSLVVLKALQAQYKCILTNAKECEASLTLARNQGYAAEDIVIIGSEFVVGNRNAADRVRGIDRIVITEDRKIDSACSVLLR